MDRGAWIGELRREPSPFANQAAPVSPWSERPPDVGDINGAVVDRVFNLVQQFAREPRQPVACLLDGEVGSGKSHLLGTLCRRAVPEGGTYSFASVNPSFNTDTPLKHLQDQIVTSLNQRPVRGQDYTQLDRIAARTIAKFLRSMHGEDSARHGQAHRLAEMIERSPGKLPVAAGQDQAKWLGVCGRVQDWLTGQHPEMWGPCLKVFFQYALESKRQDVIDWLKGENGDGLEALGLRYSEADDTLAGREDRAAKTLTTLGHLLTYDRPIVVCFDQLESLDEPARIAGFQRMVFHLFNYVPAMMILTCVRGDVWNRMRTHVEGAVVQRLEGTQFKLQPCTKPWAQALINSRLELVKRPHGAPADFPFDTPEAKKKLDETLARGALSARLVLQKANLLWHEVLGDERAVDGQTRPDAVLTAWLAEQRQKILDAPERFSPSEAVLSEALRLQLHNLPHTPGVRGCTFLDLPVEKRYVDLVARLESDERAPATAFLIDGEHHHGAVAATFKHGAKAVEKGQVERLVFVREARVPFPEKPQWPATNALLGEFRKRKHHDMRLALPEAASWFAVVYLHQAVLAGDVTLVDRAGAAHTVTIQQLQAYLKAQVPLARFAEILAVMQQHEAEAPPPPPPPAPGDLAEKIAGALRATPMRMMQAAKIAGAITPRSDVGAILTEARKHPDRFTVYGPTSDKQYVIQLKGGR